MCRTSAGIIVTVIADNYFGYSKKEVKSQISYSANLSGLYEEQHSGGAVALPRYSYGQEFDASAESARWKHLRGYSFSEAMKVVPVIFLVIITSFARTSLVSWQKDTQ